MEARTLAAARRSRRRLAAHQFEVCELLMRGRNAFFRAQALGLALGLADGHHGTGDRLLPALGLRREQAHNDAPASDLEARRGRLGYRLSKCALYSRADTCAGGLAV